MFSKSKMNSELILVDDDSTDGTFLKAKECQKKYDFPKVAVHKRNLGVTDVLMTGFSKARGKMFVFWPGVYSISPKTSRSLSIESKTDTMWCVDGHWVHAG